MDIGTAVEALAVGLAGSIGALLFFEILRYFSKEVVSVGVETSYPGDIVSLSKLATDARSRWLGPVPATDLAMAEMQSNSTPQTAIPNTYVYVDKAKLFRLLAAQDRRLHLIPYQPSRLRVLEDQQGIPWLWPESLVVTNLETNLVAGAHKKERVMRKQKDLPKSLTELMGRDAMNEALGGTGWSQPTTPILDRARGKV